MRTHPCSNFYWLQFIVVVICSFFICCISQHLPSWRRGPRFRKLTRFDEKKLTVIAQQTNISAIHQLLRPILVERVVGSPEHEKVGEFLKHAVEQYGFETEWKIGSNATPFGEKVFRNLIATFDKRKKIHRRLSLACHYDSKWFPNLKFLAATDSALPCALLLDTARTLSPLLRSSKDEETTLQLIFFDGEEAFVDWSPSDSIYGARQLAKSWENKWYVTSNGTNFELDKELHRIDALVLLDLLGAKNPEIRDTRGHGTTDLFNGFIDIERRLKELSLIKNINNIFLTGELPLGGVEDDHIPFRDRGVPIVHLIPVPFPMVWHSPFDNAAALDENTIYNLATILRVFVAEYLGLYPQK